MAPCCRCQVKEEGTENGAAGPPMGHPSVYAQLLIHKLLVDSGSLTRLVGELEVVPRCMSSLDLAHRSYAASSVIASATFLEAAVSELFQDAPSLGMWPSRATPHQFR